MTWFELLQLLYIVLILYIAYQIYTLYQGGYIIFNINILQNGH